MAYLGLLLLLFVLFIFVIFCLFLTPEISINIYLYIEGETIFCLPVNTQHSHNPHCGELVADVHHHHRFAHKVSKDPLPVSDQLVDVEGHHQQEQHVGYRQIQHVDVRDHFLLAYRHRVDDQPVGDDPHRAEDAVNGRENVHERGDVHEAVGWRCGAQT